MIPAPAVFDASALLALVQGEPGAYVVADGLPSGHVSSVNWAETVAVSYRHGLGDDVPRALRIAGLLIEPLTIDQAELAAGLHYNTSRVGLSLADCSCLALGIVMDLPVYTADRAWAELDLDIDIRLVR